MYISDFYTLRVMTPQNAVRTLAGSLITQGYADGVGSKALFGIFNTMAVDALGNIYAADKYKHTVRKITPEGLVSTLAGSVGQSGKVDGFATSARFNGPVAVAVDASGFIFVADDYNKLIRKISPAGQVSTLAGGGVCSAATTCPDGMGTAAAFYGPQYMTIDQAGNLYVMETDGAVKSTLRKITPIGLVTTIYRGTSNSDGMALDASGNFYLIDNVGQILRKLSPNGVVTKVLEVLNFSIPMDSIVIDASGNLYVGGAGVIRKVTGL